MVLKTTAQTWKTDKLMPRKTMKVFRRPPSEEEEEGIVSVVAIDKVYRGRASQRRAIDGREGGTSRREILPAPGLDVFTTMPWVSSHPFGVIV